MYFMTDHTTEMAKSALRQVRPWRAGMPWWVILLEGLIALGIGIYVLMAPNAGNSIVLLLALYLLVVHVERAIIGFRSRIPAAILAERMLRAGIGVTVGLIIVVDALIPFINPPAPLVILSLGWLLIGAIGIWEWVSARAELGLGLGALVFPVVSALFGLLMLASRLALGPLVLQSLAIVGIVAGIALLGYAFMLYRNAQAAPQA
jgi:uncharacterized membrane protein HdeD (DUF308 family)